MRTVAPSVPFAITKTGSLYTTLAAGKERRQQCKTAHGPHGEKYVTYLCRMARLPSRRPARCRLAGACAARAQAQLS